MKKMLVTGANGLLGGNLVFEAKERFDVLASSRTRPSFPFVETVAMDITHGQNISDVIGAFKPDLVVHCAAETRVDYCEDHPEQAYKINVDGTQNVAVATEDVGAYMVFVSSDSVFDGELGQYCEDDEPNPVNVYASTKLSGERVVADICSHHMILRTNIFGWNMQPKESLAEWVLNRLLSGETIHGFQDVIFNPLLVNSLSQFIFDMFEQQLNGLYHVGSLNAVSKYDFAVKIAQEFGLDEKLICRSYLNQGDLTAQRPLVTQLDVSKVEAHLKKTMPTLDAEIQKFRQIESSGQLDGMRKAFSLQSSNTV